MKPVACDASPPPPPRAERPRLPLNFVIVLRTVSMSAPEPDVRPLPPLYARVLLGVAMRSAYPENGLQTGVS
jgi:hypothetical protein